MTFISKQFIYAIFGSMCCVIHLASADQLFSSPILVHETTVESPIRHSVEWQGPLSEQRVETMLEGPTHFAQLIPNSSDSVDEESPQPAVFNWYRIADLENAKPTNENGRQASVTIGADANPTEFQLRGPAFFLSKSQRIADGAPKGKQDRLSHFVAYAIDNEVTWESDVDAGRTLGQTLGRAQFLCVPVEEWHHHDHFPVKERAECLVVFAVKAPNASPKTITALDQFGLHRLQLNSAKLVCIPSRLIDDKRESEIE